MSSIELKPYGVMVTGLFKGANFQVCAEPLVHAAMGIIGELMEMASSTDANNFIEECGDTEFYLEAFCQAVENLGHKGFREVMSKAIGETIDTWDHQLKGHDLIIHCAMPAAELLDLTKKIWVYSQPVEKHVEMLGKLMGVIYGRMGIMYAEYNMDRSKVLHLNQLKLAKRYPEGVYSDGHAAARLDKGNNTAQETTGEASA
jgi:NTP pyrophosphatase (non-canonical NTP hydrolase)